MIKRAGREHLEENRSKKKTNNPKETFITRTRRRVKKEDGIYETKTIRVRKKERTE